MQYAAHVHYTGDFHDTLRHETITIPRSSSKHIERASRE